MEDKERKRKRLSLFLSVFFHVILALIFFFTAAWREPDPPIPEYGIELNFGQSEVGSGQVYDESLEENPDQATEETQDEQDEQVEEETNDLSQEIVSDEVIEEESSDDNISPGENTAIETSDNENFAPSEEELVEQTPGSAASEGESDDANVPQQTGETETDENLPSVAESGSGQGTSEESMKDQGEETGKLDERALYGPRGTSSGASLELSGWRWDSEPTPDDQSQESGKIVFQIVVDSDGYIISIKTLEKTVSPSLERVYRNAVQELSFSKPRENFSTAPTSTGTITFIIKTK